MLKFMSFVALGLLAWKLCLLLRLGSFSGEQQLGANVIEDFYCGADPGTSGFGGFFKFYLDNGRRPDL